MHYYLNKQGGSFFTIFLLKECHAVIICVLFMSKIFFSLEIIYQELNKKNFIAMTWIITVLIIF